MKVYIYTIPKAGTYFLADFVARLGYRNTGIHVLQSRFLDTAKYDHEFNARFPLRTKVERPFMTTLRGLKDGDLAFGHFPAPLMAWMFPDTVFVCAYRHPRQTLVSEFVDFRFRRADVRSVSVDAIADDRDAFVAYLKRRGVAHMASFAQMLAVTLLHNERLCTGFPPEQIHLLGFESLLNDPQTSESLAKRLCGDESRAARALKESKAAETKTKASGLSIDREALWSPQAEELYQGLDAEAYVKRGRELGWTI